jgi:AraC family transcriptional regulator
MLAQTREPERTISPGLSHPDISISRTGTWMVARLLATATRSLEADRLTARACIQRAATLLGVDLKQANSGLPPTAYHARGGLAAWQVDLVSRYIRDHISVTIRISTLARMVQRSKSHFSRAFRCSFDETPQSYIAKRRVMRAQQIMLESEFTLAHIALEVGMCDQAHFCRTFRRVVGINPGAWRRENLSRPPRRVMEPIAPQV